jgi:alkylation response protein AidB-like acyl-CoA dehydrogenase
MISFGMTEEQELVRDTLREFAAEVVRPLARECDEASSIPADFLATCWELGLVTTQIPEAFGGGGESRAPVTNAIILEELAHGDAALAIAAMAPSQFVNTVIDQGTEDQKEALLPQFCGADYHSGSLAIIEPGPLSDPLRPRTVAEAKEDGFVLSGQKSFVVMGDRASHFIVTARVGEKLEAFIIASDAAGLTVSEPELNMGLRGVTTVALQLERVELSASARLGGDAGSDVAQIVANSRTALCAIMLGMSRAVLDYCVPYTKDRVAFDEPISKKQSIAFRLAEMHIEIEAMRNLTWQAASYIENGLDAMRESRLARSYVVEKAMWIADNGVQVLGGHGFIREHPVEMWFRNARTLGVIEGSVAI